jgi:hypothetical protein
MLHLLRKFICSICSASSFVNGLVQAAGAGLGARTMQPKVMRAS